jgi:hypothetical protein
MLSNSLSATFGRDKIAHQGGLQVSLRELAPGMPTTDHVSDKD